MRSARRSRRCRSAATAKAPGAAPAAAACSRGCAPEEVAASPAPASSIPIPVADAEHGLDLVEGGVDVADLLAPPLDERGDGPVGDARVVAARQVQQLLAREHAAAVPGQRPQD